MARPKGGFVGVGQGDGPLTIETRSVSEPGKATRLAWGVEDLSYTGNSGAGDGAIRVPILSGAC